MALKSQLDNTGIVESKKGLSQTEKKKSFESLKKPQSTKETTKQPVNNAAGAMSKVDEYLNSANVKGYNNLVKSLQNPTNTREEYYKKQEAEQQKRNNDPNNNNFVKSITDFFNKTANTYQQDKETQQKEYDIFSKDTTNVRKENADFIKQQAEAMGISEYDYVKQAKKRANNLDESKSIIDNELSNTKTSLEDNIEITLTNGEKMLGSEHGKQVKEINDSFAQMLSEKEALEAKYKTQGFTTTEAARYNNLIEQMNGLITEAGNYDIQAVGWADFETRGSEIEQQLREKKAALSIAQENGDLAAVSTLTGDIEQLEADKEANKQKLKDQEAYMISQNFDYVMEYGSAIEKEKYAEYISHRNDGLVERLYNMGTAAVIGMAASPFNFADLVLENIDRYNGKDDFDPNNPNLISNQLSDVKNRLNEFSLTGLEGTAGGYILQSVQSILPFVTTILTAKAMGITEGIDTISTLAQGFQVGAETAKQDIANGGDLATAELHGLLMGAISTLTEKIGGEGFINMISGNAVAGLLGDGVLQSVNWLDVIRIINRSSLSEGVEEVMEDLGDRAANSFINYLTGQASNLQNTSYDDFSQLGNGNELLNYGADLTNSFIMAYIGSVFLGAGTTIPGAVQNNAVYNYVTGDMAIQTQEQFDLAQHLKEQLLQGIEFNDNELVELQNKTGSEDLIAAKQNDSEGAREAIRALDAMMVRYTENSKTYGRVILLNNKSNIPTVEQSYGSLLEATKSDIIETIDITNELATNTAIANKLTEQVLEQRNISVSTEEWNSYSSSQKSGASFTSRALQKLGINNFKIIDFRTYKGFTEEERQAALTSNGFFRQSEDMIYLDINGDSKNVLTDKKRLREDVVKSVAIHELWHRIEDTQAGKELKKLIDENFTGDLQTIEAELAKVGETGKDYEIYAHFLENKLDSDSFIQQLVSMKGSAFAELANNIKSMFGNNKMFYGFAKKYYGALKQFEEHPVNKKGVVNIGDVDYQVSEELQDKDLKTLEAIVSYSKKIKTDENTTREKNLVAVHNLSEDKLQKTIELGGLVMPSIAIIKADAGHTSYGGISLVFDQSTIDPKADNANEVYAGDVWTTTFPEVEYGVDDKSLTKISHRINGDYDRSTQEVLRTLDDNNLHYALHTDGIERKLQNTEGNLKPQALENAALKYNYLLEKGEKIEIPTKHRSIFGMNYTEQEEQKIQDALVNAGFDSKEYLEAGDYEKYAPVLMDVLNEIKEEKNPVLKEKGIKFYTPEKMTFNRVDNYLTALARRIEGHTEDTMPDYEVLKSIVEEKTANDPGYEKFVDEILGTLKYEKGIRNQKDTFDNRGNRRSFKQLHYEYNAENVLKAMLQESGNDARGKQQFGGAGFGTIRSMATKEFKSIDEIIKEENRLLNGDQNYDEIKDKIIDPLSDAIFSFKNRISELLAHGRTDFESTYSANTNAAQIIQDLMAGKTRTQMQRIWNKEWANWANLTNEQVNDIFEQVAAFQEPLSKLPTNYFEAKPKRIVGFDEVKHAIVPANTSQEVKNTLTEYGIDVQEYANEAERSDLFKGLNDVKFAKKLGENRHGFNIIEEYNEDEYNSYADNRNIPRAARERLLFAQSKGVKGKGYIEDISGIYLVYGKEFDEFKVIKRRERYEQFDEIRETNGSDIFEFGLFVGYDKNINEFNNTRSTETVENEKLDDRSWQEEYYSGNDTKQGNRNWRGISITDSLGQKLLRNVRNVLRYTKITDKNHNVKRMYLQKQEGNTFFFSEVDNGTTPVYLNVINPKIVNSSNAVLDEKDIVHDGLIRRSNQGETVIINNSKQIVKTDDTTRYSKKLNSNGEQLTEDQVEHFANSAIVDKNGNLKVMYTGSPNKFTKFDKSKARKSGLYGSGFYFTESKSAASTYGNVMEVYLNITNPVDANNETRTITDKQLKKFVTELAENEDYGIENYGYGATVDSIVKSLKGKSDFALLQDLNATCVGDMVEAVELFNKVNGTNYDGIVAKTETVAFYPNQIKSVDNLSPTNNDDTQYSKKLAPLSDIDQEVKDNMLYKLAVNEGSFNDAFVRNFGKVLQQYKDATTEEAKDEARSAIEQYREQIKEIVGEKYDLGNGYSFTGRDLKRAMRAKTLDWNSIKKDLPASPAELKKARAELQKYYTIRNTGGVSADVLIDEINSEFGLDIESNGKDALYDLIAIHKDVDEKNAANTVYSGMDQLETNYGFTEEEWDKRFDDMVESYGLVTLGGVKNDVFAKFDDYLSKFGEANDPYANEAKDAKKWVQAVQKAEENTNATRNVEQTKQNFIENADKWIPNYKVLAEKYSVVSKETLGKALYEILIEGQLSEESYSKLAEDFSSDIYANKSLINQIKDFQDDAVKYFAVDAALKEDRKNIGKAVTRAMNVGKSYGSAGANFEQNYIEQKGIVESIERAEKNRKMLRDKYSPIAKTMIEAADDVATAVLSHKTLSQVLDKVWGLKNGVRTELRDTIEARKNVAQREMTELHRNYADELEEIIKDTGIKGGSKESRLAQFIREGHTNEIINGEYVPYTLEQLKKDADYKMANGKMAWENILEASERLGNAFDRLILLINITQEDIYGDAVGEKEYELAQLGVKVRLESKGMLDLMDQMKKAPTPELQLALNRAETNLNRYVNEYNALADKLQTKDAARRQFTPFRSNYVHHIAPNTFKSKLKSILRENSVPTSLVGENNASPNTAWAGFMAAQGKGEYMPDIVESFASYIRDASRVIAYNPYVYEMRQLENEIKSLDKHDRLNDFTEWWDIYLNDIAGKKNTLDKGITQMIFDNKAMNVAKLMVNQAKSATLMFNAHSALVQIANIPNGLSILNQEKDGLQSFGKGLARYLSSIGNKDNALSNAMDQSGFLAERFMDVNTQNVTLKSKINDTASWIMTVGDKMGTQIIWSAAYEQGKARNLSGIKLTEYADDITRRAVAGRGIGEVPLALKSNIFNMLVPFQVETNNQWQTLKSQLSNKQYGAVATSMVAAFLFNGIFQALGAGDVLSEWITPFFKEIKKYRKDKEEDDEMTVGDLLVNIAVGELGETLSMIPGASMIVNMFLNQDDSDDLLGEYSPSRYGTTQLGAKGIGDIVKGVYNTTTDLTSGNYYEALRDAVSTGSVAIKNFAPGGTQLVRTTEGLQSMGALPQLTANGLETTPVNYTNSGKVRYINDQSNITDWIKASLFGKWQTSAAQDYIEGGFKTVNSSTMKMYDAIEDSVGNPKEALDISKQIMGITSIKDDDGKTINNSRALQVRKELEEQGLYDEILEAINNGADPSSFNLNKTVIGYDDATFNKNYNDVVSGSKTQSTSKNKADTKANKETAMNDTKKATVADYIAKNGLGNNSKKTASNSEKLTKKEQSIVEYIAKVSNYNGTSSQKSIETTIANLLKKLGNSTADVQKNIAAMQKKTKNL